MAEKLSDDEVYDRLHAAYLALGKDKAASVVGQTSIETARQALQALQVGMLMALESGSDRNTAIISGEKPRDP